MRETVEQLIKHFLRKRIGHPLVALLLLFSFAAVSVGAANCSESCALSLQVVEAQSQKVSMDDSCCGGTGRMSCCEPSKSDSDKVTGATIKVQFRTFSPVLPGVATAPEFDSAHLASSACGSASAITASALQPSRLYIIHRSLLI
jgi:hypothetical protein